MPEEPEVFIFEIDLDGVVRTAEEPREDFSEDFSLEVKESYLSLWLNHRADDIASDIEREVRRVLRPFVVGSVAVQAEVSFKPGDSLIIAGTVMAVVGALGTVAGQAASLALGQNLARLLEIPINWLLRRWMSQGNEATGPGPLQFEPFSVNVTPAPVTQTRQQATVLPGSQESSAPPTQQQVQPAPGWLSWTSAVVTVLAILNTMLLLALLVLLLTMAASPPQPA